MKKMFLTLTMIFISQLLLSAQGLSSEAKNKLLNRINENTFDSVIDSIKQFKVVEAIPLLEQYFWKQDMINKIFFLETLDELNAPDIITFSHSYLDSLKADKFKTTWFKIIKKEIEYFKLQRVESALLAFKICFKRNDFSKVEDFFEFLDKLEPSGYYDYYLDVMLVLTGNETYQARLRPYFENLLQKPGGFSFYSKGLYVERYENIYKESALPIAKYVAANDTSASVRGSVIRRVLRKNRGADIVSFYKERLALETSELAILSMISGLIKDHSSPQNYLFVKSRFNSFSDEIKSSLRITKFNDYIPPKPDNTFSTNSMMDSLLSYHKQCTTLNWIGDSYFSLELQDLIIEAIVKLSSGDSLGTTAKIKQYQSLISEEYKDSLDNDSKFVTSDGYKFLYYDPQYILERLPEIPVVKLIDSNGNLLKDGTCQFYEGGWKDALDNQDGTFTINTNLKTISLRIIYAYGTQTMTNIPWGKGSVIFQTVNTIVELRNSEGNLIDQGTVQYYSGGWREFGATVNGIANKELLPNNYTFRMNYAFANLDKQQNIGTNPTVVFQTVNTTVQLKNSLGNFIDQSAGGGTVQYYSGGWREFGTTVNGTATKELLPNNYTFRMSYGFASNDKAQNVGTNQTVVFQTVNTTVQLRNSQNNLMPAPMGDQGAVQYYSGGWREFGTTVNGTISKELLPNNYTFRMSYGFASNDKAQNISTNPTVVFQTVNTNVEFRNSLGNLIDQGIVQYYSGGWREFGTTVNGTANKELLPNNYTFRMSYGFASNDKAQNVGTNPTVVFQTVNTNVELRNSLGSFIDQGVVQYYSGAWRNFGTTINGIVSLELLPNNYSFRMTHEFISNDKAQNIGTNSTVIFSTVLCTVRVRNAQNQPVNNATVSYYSGAWRQIGLTVNGNITRELLPANLSFRAVSGSAQQDKTQNILTNNIVEFSL